MGVEYLQWGYCIIYYGNIAEHTMGIDHLQWEYCITHDGNRLFTMGI